MSAGFSFKNTRRGDTGTLPMTSAKCQCCGQFRFRLWKSSGSGSRQCLSQFFSNKKFEQKLTFHCEKQLFLSESWPLIIYFLTFVFHFMLDLDPNPITEPEYILVPVPLRQKVAVPAVSAPQHSLLQRIPVPV
jgi:hypothetical protein